MTLNTIKRTVFTVLFLSVFSLGFAKDAKEGGDDEKFDPKEMIMHHVKDAYGMHIFTLYEGKEDERHFTIPLPIILWTDNGLTTFMSSEFHHDYDGKVIVEKNGVSFVNVHEKIYQLNAGESMVAYDEEHHPTNAEMPLDFSITRNVFMMWVSIALLLLIFLSAARRYKKSENYLPSGIASFWYCKFC